MRDRSFLPIFRSREESSPNLFRFFSPILKEAIREGYLGYWVELKWLLQRFANFRAWLSDGEAHSLANLMTRTGDFEATLMSADDVVFADYIDFLSKPQATELVTNKLRSFSVGDWTKLLSSGAPLWPRISGSRIPLLEQQNKASTLYDALTTILGSPTGSLGYHGVLKVAKLLPWLNDQARGDLVRSSLRAVVDRSDADLFLILVRNDHFRGEASRRSFLRDALIGLFDPLSRSGAGRTFIERSADVLRGVDRNLLTEVESRLVRASRSKDGAVREWAQFVRDRIS